MKSISDRSLRSLVPTMGTIFPDPESMKQSASMSQVEQIVARKSAGGAREVGSQHATLESKSVAGASEQASRANHHAAVRRHLELLNGPDAAEAHKGLGDLFARRRIDDEAVKHYRRAVKLKPGYAQAYNNLGNVLWRSRRDHEALACYRRAIALSPELIEAQTNLGLVQLDLGMIDEAVEVLESAVRNQPGSIKARVNLARALRQANRLDEAAECIEQALAAERSEGALTVAASVYRARGELDRAAVCSDEAIAGHPGMAAGYMEAAKTAAAAGRIDDAIGFARQGVEVAPTDARCFDVLGSVLHRAGLGGEAEHVLKHALQLDPGLSSALFHLGNLEEDQEKFAEAERHYREVLAMHPRFWPAAVNLGAAVLKQQRAEEAAAILRNVLEHEPGLGAAWTNLALALEDLGDYEQAAIAAKHGVSLSPEIAATHLNLGVSLQILGDTEGASSAFRSALDVKEDLAPALFCVAAVGADKSDRLVAQIYSLLQREDTGEDERSQLLFALARLHDDRGEAEQAFRAAQQGHTIEIPKVPFDYQTYYQFVRGSELIFSQDFFRERKTFGSASEKPIFIVGLPRTGTTLVEQILASHSEVFGAGELSAIPRLPKTIPERITRGRRFPDYLDDLDEPAALRLATNYLRTLRKLGGSAARVTDKMPSNVFYLGLIALLFPRARVIYYKRDPRDTFISSYFMRFRHPVPHVHDQERFAKFYKATERIMEHWRNVLPIPMIEIDYERLVADQEAVTRLILNHCGLPWEDACLEFHLTKRPVRTGSNFQVRKPLYRSSVGRYKPYEPHLSELVAALERTEVLEPGQKAS
jgi:tetratricopeptide (TPR) repeat protein